MNSKLRFAMKTWHSGRSAQFNAIVFWQSPHLTPFLLQFNGLYPQVHLNNDFSDPLVDVINEHYDLVIRISYLPDSSLITRKLCKTRHIYYASPVYIDNSAPIRQPQDIRTHRIIQYGSAKRPKWRFTTANRKTTTVSLTASLNSRDSEFLIDAAEPARVLSECRIFWLEAHWTVADWCRC